jgi:hypothetical protein
MQEEDVNVRVRKQRASAKPSKRDKDKIPGFSRWADELAPEPMKYFLNQRCAFRNRLRPVAYGSEPLLNTSGLAEVKVPELCA